MIFGKFVFLRIFNFMIMIFDLDDTLYREIDYVKSGFRAVSIYLFETFGWPVCGTQMEMLTGLRNNGRGEIFDRILKDHGVFTKTLVKRCINVYRNHMPDIYLDSAAERVLGNIKKKPYLVTDGHKVVQSNKIHSLNIKERFEKIYITHRYGLRYEKPHLHCFELIKLRENCSWTDMCYVADNPRKDFVNLNSVGVYTIRVLTGGYSGLNLEKEFEAKVRINTLDNLKQVVGGLV